MNSKSNRAKSIDTRSRQCAGWALILIILGMGALYAGTTWLVLLIPAAILVWYGARPGMRSSRN
jgi:hypothetical protein